jgi:hypothetical protein
MIEKGEYQKFKEMHDSLKSNTMVKHPSINIIRHLILNVIVVILLMIIPKLTLSQPRRDDPNSRPIGILYQMPDNSNYLVFMNVKFKIPPEIFTSQFTQYKVYIPNSSNALDKYLEKPWPPPYIPLIDYTGIPAPPRAAGGSVPYTEKIFDKNRKQWMWNQTNNPCIWIPGLIMPYTSSDPSDKHRLERDGFPTFFSVKPDPNIANQDRGFALAFGESGVLLMYDYFAPCENRFVMISSLPVKDGFFAFMSLDGNFIVYDKYSKAIWSSETSGNPGAYLKWGKCSIEITSFDGRLIKSLCSNCCLFQASCDGRIDTKSVEPPKEDPPNPDLDCLVFGCAEEFYYKNNTSHIHKLWKISNSQWTFEGDIAPYSQIQIKLVEGEVFSIKSVDKTEIEKHNENYPNLFIDQSTADVPYNYVVTEAGIFAQRKVGYSYTIQQ